VAGKLRSKGGLTAGLPLVTTRAGIAAELENQGRFGLLVPPKDRMVFRDAIRRLLRDSALRAGTGSNARAAVSARYSSTAEAGRHAEFFSELTGAEP
jgi:glycosyltransferase involved in cell wall biosynthesis